MPISNQTALDVPAIAVDGFPPFKDPDYKQDFDNHESDMGFLTVPGVRGMY